MPDANNADDTIFYVPEIDKMKKQELTPLTPKHAITFLLDIQRGIVGDSLKAADTIKQYEEDINATENRITELRGEIEKKQVLMRKSREEIEQLQKKIDACIYLVSILQSEEPNSKRAKATLEKVEDMRTRYYDKEIGKINNFNIL